MRVQVTTSEEVNRRNPNIDFVDPIDNAKRHMQAIRWRYSSGHGMNLRSPVVTIINGILMVLEALSQAVNHLVPVNIVYLLSTFFVVTWMQGIPIASAVMILLKPIKEVNESFK